MRYADGLQIAFSMDLVQPIRALFHTFLYIEIRISDLSYILDQIFSGP